jgi:glutamate synthase (NADPH/NADH) small chain
MGELGAFLKIERHGPGYRPAQGRARDYQEFVSPLPEAGLREQGARCMDCGVPFCHSGCPLGNLIPDWNDLVYHRRFREAIERLHATNNFPDFTGRLCPAPCEAACVLEIREGEAVTIKQIEQAIIDRAWAEGWIAPEPPRAESGRSVAVVGSGPAGMAAAQQLRRSGHRVELFERDEAAGGLVRFGVPDFKIEKWVVQRRVRQLCEEGVILHLGCEVGRDLGASELRERFDAVVLATGARVPRDLQVPGRELAGVHFAMEYLYERNRAIARLRGPEPELPQPQPPERPISAAGKQVVVIGGGDTGADCVGNAIREGATSVLQLELLPMPPRRRSDALTPWPLWPAKLRVSYAIEEASALGRGEQDFSRATVRFLAGDAGALGALQVAEAQPAPPFAPVQGSERELPAQLVLLAMGFLGPEQELLDQLGLERDKRSNVLAPRYETSVPGVFAAGDARRGQSLIVWAINEGRQCALAVERYLAGAASGASDARGTGVLAA